MLSVHRFLLIPFAVYWGIILTCASSHAGAWLQEKGNAELTLNNFYYETNEFFDINGNKKEQGQFTKYAIKPYIEYGLTDHWTIGGSLELQRVKQKQVGIYLSRNNPGIADPEIFARRHLYRWENNTLSVEPSVKFMSHFRDNRSPKGGTNSMEYGIALLHGRNFSLLGRNHYSDLRVEYVNRVAGLEDQFISEMRIGLSITDNLTLIPGTSTVKSISLPKNQSFTENGDIDYDLYKTELTAEYTLQDNHTLIAGGNIHTGGKNTGAGQGFNFGFRTRF